MSNGDEKRVIRQSGERFVCKPIWSDKENYARFFFFWQQRSVILARFPNFWHFRVIKINGILYNHYIDSIFL